MINLKIDIWKNYEFKQINNQRPTLTTYIIDSKINRPSIVICPGGGYGFTSPREAEPIALKFNAEGYNAFVLDYSVSPYKHPQPIYDIARSLTIIREHKKEWNIDTENITVCGFSAGGHLAASIGVFWDSSMLENVPGIERTLIKPNKLILCYPVITTGEFSHRGSFSNLLGESPSKELLDKMSLEYMVSENTPETFIWHTLEDKSVPMENSLLFISKLRLFNVSFELHIYPYGGHGLSLATPLTSDSAEQNNKHLSSWFYQCLSWLKQ